RVAGAVRGDRGCHRFRIAALVNRVDFVLLLAVVELFGKRVDAFVIAAGLCMPPLNLGDRLRSAGGAGEREHDGNARETGYAVRHETSSKRTTAMVPCLGNDSIANRAIESDLQ